MRLPQWRLVTSEFTIVWYPWDVCATVAIGAGSAGGQGISSTLESPPAAMELETARCYSLPDPFPLWASTCPVTQWPKIPISVANKCSFEMNLF